MEYKDYYKTLGVDKNATTEQIKSAYRRLARKYHPDVNPGKKEVEEKFKEINEAHSVLSDPGKRKKYDELGSNWERILRDQEFARQYAEPEAYKTGRSASFDFGDASDFFATFFGGPAGGSTFWQHISPDLGTTESHRGADYEHELEITLEEAFSGTGRAITLQAQELCPVCRGSGIIADSSSVRKGRQIITSAKACPDCRGSGAVNRAKTIKVMIPRGVTNGSRVRLAGKGGPGVHGGPDGNLYLIIKISPHRFFQVNDHNLTCELPIMDYEAALGAQVEMPSLTGKITIKIPPETQGGAVLRLKGQGLPFISENKRGDLLVKTRIVIPTRLTDEEKRVMEELKRIRTQKKPPDDPRKDLM